MNLTRKTRIIMAKEREFVKEIADIETDYAQWYTDVVLKTEHRRLRSG